eukprot:scaffold14334_cov28-Tisochrysis_lutea.AAC.6
MPRHFTPFTEFKAENVAFALGQDRAGKPSIQIVYGELCTDVSFVSPACITNCPSGPRPSKGAPTTKRNPKTAKHKTGHGPKY